MHPSWAHLLICCLLQFSFGILPAIANTEKVVFLAPERIDLPKDGPSIESLQIKTLSPTINAFRTALPVVFPNSSYPKGLQSWYVLHDLTPGTRYEVRICWAATQPTSWDLDVFSLKQTMETPELIQSLAVFAEERVISQGPEDIDDGSRPIQSPQSLLFLRVSGVADYFTLQKNLMDQPHPVKIDLILDPFLLNVFPRSLVPTALYILGIAISGWFVSGFVWQWISTSIVREKTHAE